ncbi:ROK family transcriptional regulator [Blastococcus sp. MG754426]|uniref:ROK family transcriptional regulator n=1 Tax=unclassified Blastococcus TaxID=2619396 RepID=UPI001EF0271E|nr:MULTISPECIES: ROK family transcriptional regulator [unclassified Blastococcus]MCF6509462.1 ROK family transcriptional regulator [Blastococcus sp. MG754426]MCF6513959.1 ROK family transcriptional regulator [Blastococcus sp. MG754427]
MPAERIDGLVAVLDAIRGSGGITQPQLMRVVGLGRSVVAQRVAELQDAGLVASDGLGASTGGRAPRLLRFRAESGVVAGVDIGATGMVVGLADLAGTVLSKVEEGVDVADGPEVVLSRVEQVVEGLLRAQPAPRPLWGLAVGVPGPVDVGTGLPVAPPIMPGWDGYSIPDRLGARFAAPVWVDNDVNLLALGELRTNPVAAAAGDLLYVKIGTGIGAGLVSGGRLHRGVNGCAGDIGHVVVAEAGDVVCRCGNLGCLEAAAGGAALARDGRRLAEAGGSPVLAELLAASGRVTAADVTAAADRGDPAARALLARAGRLVGSALATLVSFYNPALVVLGGGVVQAGDHVLAVIRESVYRRSLPLATRTLRIEHSTLGADAGLAGAVHLALDAIFAPHRLPQWLPFSSPAAHPELAAAMANAAA